MKTLVISSIMASALISGVAMADSSSLTQIHFNNNGNGPATVSINEKQWQIPENGVAAVNTTLPQFTFTFNPGIEGQEKTFNCTVRTDPGWLSGTTAFVQFNNNLNMAQFNTSTNNRNNDSQELIQYGIAMAPTPTSGTAVCHILLGDN